ncbi:hypothetical protein [Bacillus alkalisoli]|uniref:hypothetical protein n=1 Tax=Bacillus alkalisoli TaxID=2011008 RepID=UPI000C24AABD|nr:hypothetical protein [Bacillus alkalisoli]
MSKFDIGEEHIRYIFEKFKMNQLTSNAEQSEKTVFQQSEEVMESVEHLEKKLNNYMKRLEKWMGEN